MVEKKIFDSIIIGAGPAGLQLAYEFKKMGIDYVVLERAAIAGYFFTQFPRHRKLISINKIYSDTDDMDTRLRFDWNSLLCEEEKLLFRHYDRDYFPDANNLVTYLNDFRAHYNLNVKFNMSVKYIYRSDDLYCLKTVNEDIFYCRYLVIATGRSEEYIPEFPGVELAENYSKISVDPNAYEGKRVMIIGKGNSAFETADNMMSKASVIHMCSPNSIRLAWKTHYVGHLRAVNNSFLDTYQLKSGNTVLDAQVLKIQKRSQDTNQISVTIKYTHAEDQKRDILVDKVILCTGFKFDISMFDNSVKPELLETGKFPAINTRWESINQPHMYFAGNLMHGLDYQKTFSGFIHGFRYNVQCLARLLAEKYHNFDWPSKKISMEPSSFSREILDRMNRSSSLYQQPGFIGDVVGILENCDCARHYQDVPLNLIKEEGWKAYREYWLLFMDYGHKNILDPFNVDRFPFSKGGDDSTFLHPVLQRYREGQLVSEHHISQDLENHWVGSRFEAPLLKFLNEQVIQN